MIPGYHDQQKFAHSHRQKLLHEAEHERLLSQLPRPEYSTVRRFLARPALIMRSFRVRLQERAKNRKQVTERSAQ